MECMKFPMNPQGINPCSVCGNSTLYIVENDQTNKYKFAHFCIGVKRDEIFRMTTTEEEFETEQEAIEAWNKRA